MQIPIDNLPALLPYIHCEGDDTGADTATTFTHPLNATDTEVLDAATLDAQYIHAKGAIKQAIAASTITDDSATL